MKFFLIAFAVIAAVAADVTHLPLNEYLPPVQEAGAGQDFAVTNEYLPPVQAPAPVPVAPAPAHVLADDGYRYKTQRRVVYRRNRRDVSHLASSEYLPPAQEEVVAVEVAPIQEVSNAVVEEPIVAHQLADDGYRYKTQRRVVYRRTRRDVSHLASNEYLPPVQEAAPVLDAPVQEVAFVPEAAPAHELADDGYRYKTQRRVVYRRNRRDVSHLASNEYLPPVQEAAPFVTAEIVPFEQVAIVDEAAPAHQLADDGYRYKTQRRVVYRRNRRDVSHLPTNEYLPPVEYQESVGSVGPTNEYLPPVQQFEPAPAHQLADDGYRYKTHRRVVYRRH